MFRSASMPEGPDTQAQPVTESPRRVGFIFWLAWVLANAIGFTNAIGFAAFGIADWATGGAVGRAISTAFGNTRAQLLNFAIIGASVGLMQALVLRRRFSRSALWAQAITAGVSAGLAVYIIFGGPYWIFRLPPKWITGLAVETVIWTAQGFVLGGSFPRAIQWMLANIVGYYTGLTVGVRAGFAWAHYGLDVGVMVGLMAGGAMVGALTGIALIWLLRLPQQIPLEHPKLSIVRSMVDGLRLLRFWPILCVSILAWISAEATVLPLTQVEAPTAHATVLMLSGLVLLLAMAAFVVDTAAILIAPELLAGRGRLPILMLAVASMALVVGFPLHLLYLALSYMRDSGSTGPIFGPLVLIALVYLAPRLVLAPAVAALGGGGVYRAFRVSWQLTKDQWGRVLLLVSPVMVLWSAMAFVPVPWPAPWLSIAYGVLGGVASAWLAIVLTLAYVQLDGTSHLEQARPTWSIHKTGITGLLIFGGIAIGLAAGQRGLGPNGHGRIAFVSGYHGTTQIYVMSPDGSNVVRLTSPPGDAESPRFSPDGRRIVFVSTRGGVPQISVMNADGSSVVRFTNLPKGSDEPAFVLGGSRIAFVSLLDMSIYLMNPDGTNATHLASIPTKTLHPRLSPDGRRIVFVSIEDGQIYVMNADGSGVSPLTKLLHRALPPREAQAEYAAYMIVRGPPAISSDGRRIAFVSMDNGQLYLMNADGSNVVRLTNLPGDGASYPAFSPDGTRIVFMSYQDGQIYIMNANGSNTTRLSNLQREKRDPTISP